MLGSPPELLGFPSPVTRQDARPTAAGAGCGHGRQPQGLEGVGTADSRRVYRGVDPVTEVDLPQGRPGWGHGE